MNIKKTIYAISKKNLSGKVLIALTIFVFVAGLAIYLTTASTVSNTVGDRELPIYCVDTSEKKVALSFDAAWGNCHYAKYILLWGCMFINPIFY